MDAILRQTYHPIHDRLFCNGDRDGQERIAEQIIVRRLHPKLPSQHSFNWTGSPPFPRSFVLRGPLRSPGFRRRQGFLTESQSYRPYPLCWCRSPSSLCHHRATRCGQPTSSLPHPPVLGFGRVSDYRLAVLEDDLVVAQITKSILPFLAWKVNKLRSLSKDTAAEQGGKKVVHKLQRWIRLSANDRPKPARC